MHTRAREQSDGIRHGLVQSGWDARVCRCVCVCGRSSALSVSSIVITNRKTLGGCIWGYRCTCSPPSQCTGLSICFILISVEWLQLDVCGNRSKNTICSKMSTNRLSFIIFVVWTQCCSETRRLISVHKIQTGCSFVSVGCCLLQHVCTYIAHNPA